LAGALSALLLAGSALAHGKNTAPGHHAGQSNRAKPTETVPRPATSALPFDVGGAFDLVDQHGAHRSQIDPDGHAQLLFFGYANCLGICSAALPMMADATDILAAQGLKVRPVMITIDPSRDTVATMGDPMAKLHSDFIGLTGDKAALGMAYRAYAIEKELAYVDPDHGPVYSHGSFVYLLDARGTVLTLFPPILDGERVASIVQGYLAQKE